MAGLPENDRLARYVADTWRAQGLDHVEELCYDVLLSYPDPQRPNLVSGDICIATVFTISGWKEKMYHILNLNKIVSMYHRHDCITPSQRKSLGDFFPTSLVSPYFTASAV